MRLGILRIEVQTDQPPNPEQAKIVGAALDSDAFQRKLVLAEEFLKLSLQCYLSERTINGEPLQVSLRLIEESRV